ncbi:MAG: ABC transporter substrate-binding protein [Prevotella sp.]|nr:ABC transporter substrate-binding protein [Prevotella sp.]
MTRLLRYFLLSTLLAFTVSSVSAQQASTIRGQHKVKKKETIFGISREYGLTIEELIKANPEMNEPGYELKKGMILNIPYSKAEMEAAEAAKAAQAAQARKAEEVARATTVDVRNREIRLGIMLPLHNINGDGRRMTEYYRGVLMACDSLKKQGLSIDVHAWNTAEDGNIYKVLEDPAAAKCDLIIGPLYSKQMDALSAFVTKHDIRLVIPFSINAPQLTTNRNIFQVYQSPTEQNDVIIARFIERFKNYHTVVVDCNDSTSKKGPFTFGLRRQMEQRGMDVVVTNLKSTEANFSRAFSRMKPNVVILNTGRSQELGVAFSKINGLKANSPELDITMFGYTDWLLYTRTHLENFYKYNTYIPSVFYYNPLSAGTQRFERKYRQNFRSDMQNSLPRFAITGFDHAFFFLKGLHKYGKSFNGADGMFGYPPVQTPLKFERYGNGGLRNKTMMFIHYQPEHTVETIKF